MELEMAQGINNFTESMKMAFKIPQTLGKAEWTQVPASHSSTGARETGELSAGWLYGPVELGSFRLARNPASIH